MTKNPVLVLDGDGQRALSIVRSLGRRDVPVTAGSTRRRSLGALSGYSSGRYVHPDPADEATFVDHLVDYLGRTDHAAVFAPRGATAALLSRHRVAIEATGTVAGVEDWTRHRFTHDAGRLFDLAASLDVPIPTTTAPLSLDAVEEVADDLSYPVVVRPRWQTGWGDGDCVGISPVAERAESPDDLRATYRRLLDRHPALVDHPPLVQEHVPGTTVTTAVLADAGRVRAHFQEERLHSAPDRANRGSAAVLGALCDPRALTYAERVIAALEWTGPATVTFVRTPDECYLVDVGGHYWRSLPFAIDCGVDVPWLHYRQLRGERATHDGEHRTDVVERHLLSGGEAWPSGWPDAGGSRAFAAFLATFLTASHAFVSREDPLPSAWAMARLPVSAARALAAGSDPGPSRRDDERLLSTGITR